MKTVLSQLPSRELNKASSVCKAWNETARIIKKFRHEIYNVSNHQSFEDHSVIEEMIHSMKSEPCLCLTFLTNQGLNVIPPQYAYSLSQQHSSGRCSEYKILQYLKDNLPNNCLVVGAVTPGIIVTQNYSPLTAEVENGDAFGLLCIPDCPQVVLKNFYLDRCKMRKVGVAITSQPNTVGPLLNISETDHLKCLIIIGTDPYKESKAIESICGFVRSSYPNVAIGGGFVEAIVHPDIPDRQRHSGIMGLAFCGEAVKASSAVIPQDVTNPEDVEKIILEMKQKHILGKRNIAFMFACVARGVHLYGRGDVESTIFRKCFPTTPLLGFFGNGEIGVNVSSDERVIPSTRKKPRTTCLYSYATTFTLLSFPE